MGRRKRAVSVQPPPAEVIDVTASPILNLPRELNALLPKGLRRGTGARTAQKSPLAYVIAQIPGGRRAVFGMLALSDDPQAVAASEVWKTIIDGDRYDVSMEELIERAGLTPREFVGCVSRVAFDFNVELGNTLAAFAYPKLMKASIDHSLRPKAETERRMHLEHSGFAAPSRPFIQVNQHNQQNNLIRESGPGEATPHARIVRQVVRDLPPAES